MSAMHGQTDDSHEALMQFLYWAPIGLAQTTRSGDIELINPKAAQLLMPISGNGALDNLFTVLERHVPQLRAWTEAFGPATGIVCESVRFSVEGLPGVPPRMLSISLMKLGETRLMATVGDATADADREQKTIAMHLHRADRVDSLTQMPNRKAVLDLVQTVLDRPPELTSEYAVVFINCDRFNQINDTFGHHAGDEVLALMAGRLRSTLRPRDRLGRGGSNAQIAARVGGDEFVVVLDDLRRSEDAHAVAGRLLDALSRPYGIASHQLHCGVSMGILLRAQACGDADRVLQDASIAMAEAKRAGGSRYVIFEPPMQERAVRRGGIETELRNALLRGELFVVYQPVVDLHGADGIDYSAGVEALVRWRHPERGIVPPGEFIAIAEEIGLIGELGDFVLAAACRQFVAWRTELGADAPRLLAVNLSRAQLAAPGFVESVRRVLETTGMPAYCLQLEVTESLAAQDGEVQGRLHELKALGLTLALDDFGTGYSSLASLHELPVDVVKIDRSFVSQADTSRHHRVLVEATIRVANSLGMRTVAEGIETHAQAAVVRELGCDKGQGYLFSRPLSATDIGPWIREGAARDVAGLALPA